MYWRNRVEILFLSPTRLAALTPRVIRSTSRSIKSTTSWRRRRSLSCSFFSSVLLLSCISCQASRRSRSVRIRSTSCRASQRRANDCRQVTWVDTRIRKRLSRKSVHL
ncbi:hypothetical protein EYF80_041027 [Liparis tanakae]|uniref:Uncharacterized protein n=1 Tax=Liparis tanakae TaxID=230148 RepID=A0A4Z2G5F2_9TELE|nr:hypothetical protein EYF80_041027 [Liparis tanakae]